MNTPVNHIEKIKYNAAMAWFLTAMLLLIGANIIKGIIVFLLTKLYEIFIQRNIFKS